MRRPELAKWLRGNTNTFLRVFETLDELSGAAASAFARATRAAVRARGRFSVALSGGTTPRKLYRRLAADISLSIPWNDVHIFWSDERFVAREHPDSNYRMVQETMLLDVGIPAAHVHRPPTEHDHPEESALRYEDAVRAFFHPGPPRFDWMLLGLGEDGHVASLFPDSAALDETERLVVAVADSPKPPSVRLTMTLPLMNVSAEIHFLVAGPEKHGVLFEVLRGVDAERPASRVQPVNGSLHWWVDRLAARRARFARARDVETSK